MAGSPHGTVKLDRALFCDIPAVTVAPLMDCAPDRLSSWSDAGEINKALCVVLAKTPTEWMGGEQRKAFPFDISEFFRSLEAHPGRLIPIAQKP